MKQESLLASMPKLILVVSLIVCIGAVMGLMGWVMMKKPVEVKTPEVLKVKECIEEGKKFYLKPGEPQLKECCSGLKTGTFYSIVEDNCFPETVISVCIDCPNNICGPGENKCNCPEDCEEETNISDWKTYRNKEYGFEVKYPEDYFFEQGAYASNEEYRKSWIQFADSEWEDQGVHNPSLIIDLIKTDLSFKEYLNKTGNEGSIIDETCLKGATYCSVKNEKDISIGDDKIQALQFSSAAVSGSDNHVLIKNKEYIIDLRKHNSGMGNFPDDVFNQILSTFKFTEKGEKLDWLPVNALYFSSLVSLDNQKIVWTENKFQENKMNSKLMLADLDGRNKKTLLKKDFYGEKYLNPIKWSNSNEEIYFSEQHGGLGGYIIFSGPSNLSKINIYTGKSECLFEESNRIGYIGDISPNEELIAYFPRIAGNPKLAIKNMKTDKENMVDIPIDEGFKNGGNAHFSPDNKHLVYNIAYCDPDNEYYRTVVVNSSGESQRVIIDDSQKIYRTRGWISNDEVLLRGPNNTDYIIDISGNNLRKK